MKRSFLIYVVIVVLCAPITTAIRSAGSCNSVPYIAIRSQGLDSARALVGWANNYHINLYDTCQFYGSFTATLEYTQSFNANHLARCLFGSGLTLIGDCPTIHISGSKVAHRGEHDWLADYFGLPRDFESTVTLGPTIENIIADFNLYVAFDECIPGLYGKVYLPIVHTRWNLNPKETVENRGVLGYEAGYFGAREIPVSQLAHRATEFFSGNFALHKNSQPLRASKWAIENNCQHTLTATKIAEVRLMLGYNAWLERDSHLGFELRGAIPTGTLPTGEFLFEPVVGNGHHGELGVGFSGHILFWEDDDTDGTFGFYADANITHLFKNTQCRVFDLCNKADSRYMLAMTLRPQSGNTLLRGNELPATESPTENFTDAEAVFSGSYAPIANLSWTQVDVSYGAQGEITLLFDYTCNGWSYDVGYNFWARTCTKFGNPCVTLANNSFALKGDGHVFGFPLVNTAGSANADIDINGVPLSATEHNATIFSGTNILRCNTPPHPERNPNVDNPEFAYSDSLPVLATNSTDRTVSEALEDQTRTSIQPVFLSQDTLFIKGARSRGITHKLFAHLSYTGCDKEWWTPFLGLGGKIEWATKDNGCSFDCQQTTFCPTPCNPCPPVCRPLPTMCTPTDCNQACSSCRVCAVSEWGVWLKGGISFH